MALTGDQIVASNGAISAARANVAAAERAAGPGGYVFPSKEQRTASAMRDTLTQIEAIYAGMLDDSTPFASQADVDRVIANAAQLASPAFQASMNRSVTTVGDAASAVLPSMQTVGNVLTLALWGAVIWGAVILFSDAKGAAKSVRAFLPR